MKREAMNAAQWRARLAELEYGKVTPLQMVALQYAGGEAYFPLSTWAQIDEAQRTLDPLEPEDVAKAREVLVRVAVDLRDQAQMAEKGGEDRWRERLMSVADEVSSYAESLQGASEMDLAGVHGSLLGLTMESKAVPA
jgi:hypothetical protein